MPPTDTPGAAGIRRGPGALARTFPDLSDIGPEGDRTLGAGLAAVALLAGAVGLGSGWFGAPPVPRDIAARTVTLTAPLSGRADMADHAILRHPDRPTPDRTDGPHPVLAMQ